jgi:hypothetical protein
MGLDLNLKAPLLSEYATLANAILLSLLFEDHVTVTIA